MTPTDDRLSASNVETKEWLRLKRYAAEFFFQRQFSDIYEVLTDGPPVVNISSKQPCDIMAYKRSTNIYIIAQVNNGHFPMTV